jgi:hypothetical protein
MAHPAARRVVAIQCAHLLLCAVTALCIASAIRLGRAEWVAAAALAVGGSIALAVVSPGALDGNHSGAPTRAARPGRPGYHAYVRRRLGSPRHVARFAFLLLVRPLLAPSFARFWWYWNPPYAYVLRYFVYAPLRARVPYRLALYLTFLASGLLLHDLPFNFTADWSRGVTPVPDVTMLFAILGALTLLSETLKVDLSRRSAWARAAANLGWIGAAFAIRALLAHLWRHQ